jgi:hypothetical protein
MITTTDIFCQQSELTAENCMKNALSVSNNYADRDRILIAIGKADARETLAVWMIARDYATGNGETTEDLLNELGQQLDTHWEVILEERINTAITKLHCLIDGGEECRGMDSALSDIIRTLEGVES